MLESGKVTIRVKTLQQSVHGFLVKVPYCVRYFDTQQEVIVDVKPGKHQIILSSLMVEVASFFRSLASYLLKAGKTVFSTLVTTSHSHVVLLLWQSRDSVN